MVDGIKIKIGNGIPSTQVQDERSTKKKLQREVVNVPVVFNRCNRSHCELLDWLDEQTTNRSGYLRECLLIRKLSQK